MPARVIRSEIVTSRSLSRVSLEADLTFRNLLLVVDDFGRCDARLPVLRAALYASRPTVTEQHLAGWLDELEREGCIERYESKGDAYLWLPKWETHRGKSKRADRSKLPDPPGWPGKDTGTPGIPGKETDEDTTSVTLPENHGNPRESPLLVSGSGICSLVGGGGSGASALAGADAPVEPKKPDPEPEHPDGSLAPAEPSEFMLTALAGIFPKVPARTLRLSARACLAYYRARGERRADWTAQVENWIAKDLAEQGPQRPPTMSPPVQPQGPGP